jgi:hypothetical protein
LATGNGNRIQRSLKPPCGAASSVRSESRQNPEAPFSSSFTPRSRARFATASRVCAAAAARHPIDLTIVDIEGVPALESAGGHKIPVVFIDGTKRFFGHVDPMLLERLLDAEAG